jgi:hypothetical protein
MEDHLAKYALAIARAADCLPHLRAKGEPWGRRETCEETWGRDVNVGCGKSHFGGHGKVGTGF